MRGRRWGNRKRSNHHNFSIIPSHLSSPYLGRWPHVHFEIYPSLEKAPGANNIVHTSRMTVAEADWKTVFEADGYRISACNFPQISLATDNVFRNGYANQLARMAGDVANGYRVKLTVGVAV